MDSRYESIGMSDFSKSGFVKISDAEKPAPPRRSSLSWLWVLFTHFLGFLWLVPIILLLYYNLSSHIIGPSASCPLTGCKADPLGTGNSRWMVKLDHNDHNTLGVLQLVAKVLELWFLFVAISLLYNIAMGLASNEGGLPLGLLSSPVEFADPRSLWDVFRSISQTTGSRRKERFMAKARIYLFVTFVALMCVICNLMGPAVAVLVLPTLQWRDLPKHAQHSFESIGIGNTPNGTEAFPSCSNDNLTDGFFSCTTIPYAASLDAWSESVIASDSQITKEYSDTQSQGISAEGDLFFTFNTTDNHLSATWAPNRQVLRELSADIDYFESASLNLSSNPAYFAYNSSLNTILKRKGPILGAYYSWYKPANITKIIVDRDQEVHCYPGYPGFAKDFYTKCLRVGTGWGPLNKLANFSAVASHDDPIEYATVSTFFSDKAAYFNETFNAGLISPSCYVNGTLDSSTDCNFETIFSSPAPANLSEYSSNMLSVEMTLPALFPGKTMVFEFFTFYSFSTYTLDTSPQSNPLWLVQVDGFPEPKKDGLNTIPVDPDWFLAAWSADRGGLIANRSSSISLIRGLWAEFESISSDNATLEDTGNGPFLNATSSYSATATANTSETLVSVTPIATSARDSAERRGVNLHRINVRDTAPTITASSALSSVASSSGYLYVPTTSLTPESDETSLQIDWFYGQNSENGDDKQSLDLENFLAYSYLQTLSLVPFTKSNLTKNNTDTKSSVHPTLWYYGRVHVWAYGIDTRTSKLGIVVTIIGCVCVLLSTVLGLIKRRRQRSLTELLVAAIEHRHQGELDHAQGDDEMKARTRFRIEEDQHDGQVRFRPLR